MSDADRVNANMGIYGGFTKETGLDAGIDRLDGRQEPDFEPVDDLTRFVKARIIEAEFEPRGEVLAMYDEPAGPMAHRYAKYVRQDMVAFRRVVVEYVAAVDRYHNAEDVLHVPAAMDWARALYRAVLAVASRWSDHHEFRDEWRLE